MTFFLLGCDFLQQKYNVLWLFSHYVMTFYSKNLQFSDFFHYYFMNHNYHPKMLSVVY